MAASTPAGTAAVVVHKHLTTEAGAHSASAAAAQAKVKLQKRHQTELLEAALTSPQQRTQGQVGAWHSQRHPVQHSNAAPACQLSWCAYLCVNPTGRRSSCSVTF